MRTHTTRAAALIGLAAVLGPLSGALILLAGSAGWAASPETSGTRPSAGISAQTSEMEWGVQLAGAFSREQALASFDRARMMLPGVIPDDPPVIVSGPLGHRGPGLFYRAHIRTGSRAAAGELCAMIHTAGGSCVVVPISSAR